MSNQLLEITPEPHLVAKRGWVHQNNLLFYGTNQYDIRHVTTYWKVVIGVDKDNHRFLQIGQRRFALATEIAMLVKLENQFSPPNNAEVIRLHQQAILKIK